MLHDESKCWQKGDKKVNFYNDNLKEVKKEQVEKEKLLTVVKAEECPWENSKQGKIKHLIHEKMGTRLKSTEAYMQILPPAGKSGKHRHMAEEIIYILEGKGYDLHWDTEVELKDKYHWKILGTPKKFEWEEGDVVYIPVNTVHQHFNADPDKIARFISAVNPIYKFLGYNDLEQLEDAPEYKE